jgi:hypothetical protein
MKNIRAKKLKSGYIYSKNNYSVYWVPNKFIFSSLYSAVGFKTLKGLKEYFKNNY